MDGYKMGHKPAFYRRAICFYFLPVICRVLICTTMPPFLFFTGNALYSCRPLHSPIPFPVSTRKTWPFVHTQPSALREHQAASVRAGPFFQTPVSAISPPPKALSPYLAALSIFQPHRCVFLQTGYQYSHYPFLLHAALFLLLLKPE
jgi:hypothetical protein